MISVVIFLTKIFGRKHLGAMAGLPVKFASGCKSDEGFVSIMLTVIPEVFLIVSLGTRWLRVQEDMCMSWYWYDVSQGV